ncbi:MAG: hypothetical protein ACRDHP_04955, partial [Ktedonobacterales bacterium]
LTVFVRLCPSRRHAPYATLDVSGARFGTPRQEALHDFRNCGKNGNRPTTFHGFRQNRQPPPPIIRREPSPRTSPPAHILASFRHSLPLGLPRHSSRHLE